MGKSQKEKNKKNLLSSQQDLMCLLVSFPSATCGIQLLLCQSLKTLRINVNFCFVPIHSGFKEVIFWICVHNSSRVQNVTWPVPHVSKADTVCILWAAHFVCKSLSSCLVYCFWSTDRLTLAEGIHVNSANNFPFL